MSSRAWTVLLLCFVCETSFADTLVLKSGESKKGKVLEETEKSVLFNSQADGLVTEVPRSEIAIVDKDVTSGSAPAKGSVQFFSVAPKKQEVKKKSFFEMLEKEGGDATEKSLETKRSQEGKEEAPDQAAVLQPLIKVIAGWLHNHPEAENYVQEWKERSKNNKEDLDKLAKTANEA